MHSYYGSYGNDEDGDNYYREIRPKIPPPRVLGVVLALAKVCLFFLLHTIICLWLLYTKYDLDNSNTIAIAFRLFMF